MSTPSPARAARLILPLLAGLLCVAAWGTFYVGYFNDDVMYIALARSLAGGTGYHDIEFPGAPPHLKYPPLLPLLLTPLQAAWPQALVPMQAIGVLCAVASVALLLALLADERGPMRWAPALLLACNPFVVRYASTVLSDVPFMAVLLLYLLAARPLLRGEGGLAGAAGLGLLAALAFYLRSVGAVLVPATVAAMLVHRRGWRPIAAWLVACGAAVAPWVLRRGLLGYQGDVVTNYQADPWYGIVARNLGFYIPGLPMTLWGDPIRMLGLVLQDPAWAALWVAVAATWLLVAWGFVQREGRRPSLAAIVLVVYGGLFLLWPYTDIRFFVPVLPLLLLYLCAGVRALCERAAPARADAVVAGLSLVVAAWLIGIDLYNATHTAPEERDPPRATCAWVRDHIPAGAAVKTRAGALWLYTGRLVDVLAPWPGTPEGATRDLLRSGSEWILLRGGAAPDDCGPEWLATLRGRPGMFTEAYANASESAVVFHVTGDRDRFLRAYDAFVRGVQAAQAERLPDSLQALQTCLSLEPDFPPAEFNLALLTWRAGDGREAERLLQGLLSRHPDHARAGALLQQIRGGAAPR